MKPQRPRVSTSFIPVSEMRQVHSLRDLLAASADTQTCLPESDHLSSPPARSVRAEGGRPGPSESSRRASAESGKWGCRSRRAPEAKTKQVPPAAGTPSSPAHRLPSTGRSDQCRHVAPVTSQCLRSRLFSVVQGRPTSQPAQPSCTPPLPAGTPRAMPPQRAHPEPLRPLYSKHPSCSEHGCRVYTDHSLSSAEGRGPTRGRDGVRWPHTHTRPSMSWSSALLMASPCGSVVKAEVLRAVLFGSRRTMTSRECVSQKSLCPGEGITYVGGGKYS